MLATQETTPPTFLEEDPLSEQLLETMQDLPLVIITLGQLCAHGCQEETGCKQFNDCPRRS